MTDYVG